MRCEMMRRMKRVTGWTGAALIALAGGHAMAGPEQDDVIVERHIQSSMTNGKGDRVEVRIEGATGEVIVNGEAVGEFQTDGDWTEQQFDGLDGRIVRVLKQPGGVLLIEQNGSTMKIGSPDIEFGEAFRLRLDQNLLSSDPALWAFNNGFNQARSIVLALQQPKVMLGVTMTRPSAEQAATLGIDSAQATVLGSVIDGLPAAKAGLQPMDIVIGVEGAEHAGESIIREKLETLEPGDTLTLTVLRNGEKQRFEVTLEPYDAERLGVMQIAPLDIEWQQEDPELDALRREQDELKRRYAEAMQRSLSADGQRARERASAEAEKLNAQMKELTAQIAKRMARQNVLEVFNNQGFAQIVPQVITGEDGEIIVVPEVFQTPPLPGQEGQWRQRLAESEAMLGQREARIRELEERLEAMSQKMDRLEALLLELKERSRDQ